MNRSEDLIPGLLVAECQDPVAVEAEWQWKIRTHPETHRLPLQSLVYGVVEATPQVRSIPTVVFTVLVPPLQPMTVDWEGSILLQEQV